MTCRDEILDAFRVLTTRHGREIFSPSEIVAELWRRGSQYRESTIRTHIVSRMCADAPDHHAVVYDDLQRVGPAQYRLKQS